jgi:hypothetical protein
MRPLATITADTLGWYGWYVWRLQFASCASVSVESLFCHTYACQEIETGSATAGTRMVQVSMM